MASPFIDRMLQSEVFRPQGGPRPGREHMLLVVGLGLGSVLRQPDGTLSDGGRYTQNTAQRLGMPALAYARLGIPEGHSVRDLVAIRRALNPADGSYDQTMADVGAVLRSRAPGLVRVVNGHSGGAMTSASPALHETLEAEGAVLTELAALHNFPTPFPVIRGIVARRDYQRAVEDTTIKPPKPADEINLADSRQPAGNLRTYRDMLLYGPVASTDHALTDLERAVVPTAVELAGRGLYCDVLDLGALAVMLNGCDNVTASIRPDVTHAWYNATDNNAAAIEAGLQVIGLLPPDKPS